MVLVYVCDDVHILIKFIILCLFFQAVAAILTIIQNRPPVIIDDYNIIDKIQV